MFTVAVTGADDRSANLATLPAVVQAALAAKAADLAKRLQAHVVQDKLSGQVLRSKTGALKASIMTGAEVDGDTIRFRVFSSDVKYAAIQEYGGQTPPHEIVPDKAKALAFMVGGKQVFATVVHHPGSKIPERSYMRSALADMAGQIATELKDAVLASVSGAVS
jgi:phage gpG-like protein